MRLHHIGYLVSDLNKSINALALFETDIVIRDYTDNNRKAVFALIKTGDNLVELIQPLTDSNLHSLKIRFENMPYHLCFSCKEIEKQFERLREHGFFPVEEINPSALFEGKRVCFLFNKAIGIIELIEE